MGSFSEEEGANLGNKPTTNRPRDSSKLSTLTNIVIKTEVVCTGVGWRKPGTGLREERTEYAG